MKIQKLHIENFQKHKRLSLRFVDGLNILSGTSDIGKSSIIRALLWVLTNKPAGFSFRTWGAKTPTKVTLEFVDDKGHLRVLTRERSDTNNQYILDDQKFVAMKSEVPEEIAALLRLSENSIQTQFASPFLLSATPGAVSNLLNSVCNLEIIDATIKNVSSIVTKAKAEAENQEKTREQLALMLHKLNWVNPAKDAHKKIAEQFAIIKKTVDGKNAIEKILRSLEAVEQSRQKSNAAFFVDELQKCNKLVADWKAEKAQVDYLQKAIAVWAANAQKIVIARRLAFVDVESLEVQKTALQEEKADCAAIEFVIMQVRKFEEKIKVQKEKFDAAKAELAEIWDSQEICPLCEKPLGAQ